MYLFNYVRYHVMQLSKDLDQGQFCLVAIVWAIWKAQYDQVYQGNSQAPQFVLNSAISMHQMGESHTKRQLAAETSMAELTGQQPATRYDLHSGWVFSHTRSGRNGVRNSYKQCAGTIWGGIFCTTLTFPKRPWRYYLLEGMKVAVENGIASCTFLTDSMELVKIFNTTRIPVSVDWRAHSETMQVWSIMRAYRGFVCKHIQRERNVMAHKLTNLG